MHLCFGKKEQEKYLDRKGAYLIPFDKDGLIGIVQTDKGFFLLGGGLKEKESDISCINREVLEEIGYRVAISFQICSAESYYKSSTLGYFHPIQTYYLGELLEKTSEPLEKNHFLVWKKYEDIKGKMYLEMQDWALEISIKFRKMQNKNLQ